MHRNWKLKIARSERGMRQKDLAAKVGCSPYTVHAIECGKLSPGDDLRNRINTALGYEEDDLFGPPEEMDVSVSSTREGLVIVVPFGCFREMAKAT